MIFINQILDEIERLVNSSENYFIVKNKLNELWSKIYLKEKRDSFREQIKEDYDSIERILNLEQKLFNYIDQSSFKLF